MTNSESYRWLIHATNGWGLGHVARTLALARQIRARAPRSEFLFLTNSEASNLIWREGFPSVKTPSAQAVHLGLIESKVAIPMGRALAASVYAAFRPHVIVSDTFPLGGNNELPPLLTSWAQKVIVYREVQAEAYRQQSTQDMLRRYDIFLIAHAPGEAKVTLPGNLTVKECGDMLIRSREEGLPRAEARRRLGLPEDGFFIYLGLGGGGDSEYRAMFERVVAHAADMPGWKLVWAAPPLLRGGMPESADGRIREVRYFPLGEVWNAFDGAISLMGANTVAELLHNGVPSVFLPPRGGLHDDQAARGRRVMEGRAGWVMDSLDDDACKAAFAALADPAWRKEAAANGPKLVPVNGAAAAAEFLLKHLSGIENLGLAPRLPKPD